MKREHLIQIALVALSVMFVVASAMVVLTHGSPRSVRWKLRLGALILNFTALTACGPGSPLNPVVMCYAPIEEDRMDITSPTPQVENGWLESIHLEEAGPHTLGGKIESRTGTEYSFRLCEGYPAPEPGNDTPSCEGKPVVQSEAITAADGAMDEYAEEFTLTLPDEMHGDYTLELFAANEDKQEGGAYRRSTYKVVVAKSGEQPK